jgi:hypothetical protein
MAELAAGTLTSSRPETGGRPPIVRTVFYVLFAGWLGTILGLLALAAPSLLGVGTFPVDGRGADWFAPHTPGAILADVAAIGVFAWSCGLTVRFCLGWVWSQDPPAWTWTASTLGAAGLLAAGTGVTTPAAGVLAALALRYTAYRADGAIRPEPLALGRRTGVVVALAVPVLAIGVATAFAIYHPLKMGGLGADRATLARGVKPALVWGPVLHNDGGRPVRVLGVEPGEEHGYALHLTDVELVPAVGYLRDRQPLRPFVIPAHGDSHTAGSLILTVSRAGCRRGTSGRIASLRVRYALGGERSTLLKLTEPLTLSC